MPAGTPNPNPPPVPQYPAPEPAKTPYVMYIAMGIVAVAVVAFLLAAFF